MLGYDREPKLVVPDMLGDFVGVESVAHTIQVALTPIFFLSGIASLLGVFSTRLARVADRVDALTEKIREVEGAERAALQKRLDYLRRRSHALDAAVILGAVAGGATCLAAAVLFIGTLRDKAVVSLLFLSFGLALLCTMGSLTAFLVEMLLASRGLRDQAAKADDVSEPCDAPEEANVGAQNDGSPQS